MMGPLCSSRSLDSEPPTYNASIAIAPRERAILSKVLPLVRPATPAIAHSLTTTKAMDRLRTWVFRTLFFDYGGPKSILRASRRPPEEEVLTFRALAKSVGDLAFCDDSECLPDNWLPQFQEWICYPAIAMGIPLEVTLLMLDRCYQNLDQSTRTYHSCLRDILRNRGGQEALETKVTIDRDVIVPLVAPDHDAEWDMLRSIKRYRRKLNHSEDHEARFTAAIEKHNKEHGYDPYVSFTFRRTGPDSYRLIPWRERPAEPGEEERARDAPVDSFEHTLWRENLHRSQAVHRKRARKAQQRGLREMLRRWFFLLS